MTPTLPPLPKPLSNLPGYCRDAIESYARQAIAADRAALLPEVLRLADEMATRKLDAYIAGDFGEGLEEDRHRARHDAARAALAALIEVKP